MSENNTYQYKLIRDIPLFINPDNPEDVSKKLDSDGEFLNYVPNFSKTYRAKTSEIITKLQINSLNTDDKTTAGAINELKADIDNITGGVDIEQLADEVTTLKGRVTPLESNVTALQNTVNRIDTDAIEELQDIVEYQQPEEELTYLIVPYNQTTGTTIKYNFTYEENGRNVIISDPYDIDPDVQPGVIVQCIRKIENSNGVSIFQSTNCITRPSSDDSSKSQSITYGSLAGQQKINLQWNTPYIVYTTYSDEPFEVTVKSPIKIKENKIPDVYVKYESSTIGNATIPVYVENGQATTGSQYVAKSGGTFTGSVVFDKTITSNGNINAYGGTLVAGKATGEYGNIRIYNQVAKTNGQRSYASIQARKPGTDGNNVYYIDKSGAGTFVFKTSENGTAVGSAIKPIYITGDGTATASSSTVGSSTKPIYMSSGTLTASSSTVGSTTKPVYLNNGTITALGYSFDQNLNKSNSPTFHIPLVDGIKSNDTTDGDLHIYANSANKGNIYLRAKEIKCVNYNNSTNGWVTLACKSVWQSSSKKIKENIKPFTQEQAKKILNINPVSFDFIKQAGGEKNQVGVIAEEALKVIPASVRVPQGYEENSNNLTDTPSVNYSSFIPYLIKMVQIQQQQINSLQERIQTLQNKNN